jgi:hypothetical protein
MGNHVRLIAKTSDAWTKGIWQRLGPWVGAFFIHNHRRDVDASCRYGICPDFDGNGEVNLLDLLALLLGIGN